MRNVTWYMVIAFVLISYFYITGIVGTIGGFIGICIGWCDAHREHVRVGLEYSKIWLRNKLLQWLNLEPINVSRHCILYPYYTTNGELQYFPFIKRGPREKFTSLEIIAKDNLSRERIQLAAGPYLDFYQIPIDIKYFDGLEKLVFENVSNGRKVVIPSEAVSERPDNTNEWQGGYPIVL